MKGRRLPIGGGSRTSPGGEHADTATKTPAGDGNGLPPGTSRRPQRSRSPMSAPSTNSKSAKAAKDQPSLAKSPPSSSFSSHEAASEVGYSQAKVPKAGSFLDANTKASASVGGSEIEETNSRSKDTVPSIQASLPDGRQPMVRLIVDGKQYAPDPDDLVYVDAAGVGIDGNQYFCQVCHGFGEIVCCDGCPKVYHPGCIPLDDPSRQSLDRDDDPWFCPLCTKKRQGKGGADAFNSQSRQSSSSKGDARRSSHQRCVECHSDREDLKLTPCHGCGNYVHHPPCLQSLEDADVEGVFCSTCRAMDDMSEDEYHRREMARIGLSADDAMDMEIEGDEEEMVGSSHTPDGGASRKKRKTRSESVSKDPSEGDPKRRKTDKKKRKKAPRESKSPSPVPPAMDAGEMFGARPPAAGGLAQATPAFFFYLSENRGKVERSLARNHRYFNRLPKGSERNALIAQEAATWWANLRPSEHRRYINMSMRDYENRIIEWKEEKNLVDMGVYDDHSTPLPDEDVVIPDEDNYEDDKLTYERHERLFLSTSVGSKPFKPEAGQSYNRVLLDLLHDMRFHPLPMICVNRSETVTVIDDHNAKVTIPYFDVHGPVSTSVGDECLGCTRGWLHFCPVLKRRVPAIEHRARLQPPVSTWTATRVGLGLRPAKEIPFEEDLQGETGAFAWSHSHEWRQMRQLPVLPSPSLTNPSERADDVAFFIEETMAMKVPEPPRPSPPVPPGSGSSSASRKLPLHRKDSSVEGSENGEAAVYKCGRCRTIIYNDTGCVQCRRAQLVINTVKPSSNGSSVGEKTEHFKVKTLMLSRVHVKDGYSEDQSQGDMAVSNALLKERWTPNAILPPIKVALPGSKKNATGNVDVDDEEKKDEGAASVVDDAEGGGSVDDEAEPMDLDKEDTKYGEDGAAKRPQRTSRGTPSSAFSEREENDRESELKEKKKKLSELQKKTISVACCGMLLALRRRDPLLLFAEPATADGYSDIIKNPIDLGTIRKSVLEEKYTSIGAFVSDVRLLCENALAFNPAGSIYTKTAKDLYDLLEIMQKRASDWSGAVADAYANYQHRGASTDEDPFASLRKKWPQAVEMLENGDWLRSQLQADFMRTQENETAYYGSLAVRRVAAAAERSLASYTDAGGIHSLVCRRSHQQDERLRQMIDEKVASLTLPLQLKEVSSWREESVVRLLRKVQSRRLDRRSASDSGCSRCDGIDSIRETMKASNVDFAHPGRGKRKGEGDLERIHKSRTYLTTGLGSAKTCQKIVRRSASSTDPNASLEDVCVSVRGSKIHGWGLFAEQPFQKGDIVAEYLGEYVANPTADKREKAYREQRIQDYQFRLDENLVIDATKKGGHGRYINHNCTPNCYARITPGEEPKAHLKRVLIIAQKSIEINEEITYDYQFPLELNLKNRIPCNCQSDQCRGFMNWDIPEKGANRALLVQKRGANMRDRIRRLGRPLKRDET